MPNAGSSCPGNNAFGGWPRSLTTQGAKNARKISSTMKPSAIVATRSSRKRSQKSCHGARPATASHGAERRPAGRPRLDDRADGGRHREGAPECVRMPSRCPLRCRRSILREDDRRDAWSGRSADDGILRSVDRGGGAGLGYREGRWIATRVPAPGAETTSIRPPAASTRTRCAASPMWPSASRSVSCSTAKPRPSSATPSSSSPSASTRRSVSSVACAC